MAEHTQLAAAPALWTAEPASRPDRARIRARIAGMHCSLCTGTIEKALGRHAGVDKVAVSLTHEQALVEYDPARVAPAELLATLRDLGYSVSDPRKALPYEAEEHALVREGRRFLAAAAASLAAVALIAEPIDAWRVSLDAVVALGLLGFVLLVLRPAGRGRAVASTLVLAVGAGALLWLQVSGALDAAVPWLTAALALAVTFGAGRHFVRMAWQSIRRGILNQHVLLEAAAIAGLAGGLYGMTLAPPGFPTAPFFAVAVLVGTYHTFSEWLSLIVKTRSSQAVRRLLALAPETAHVLRDGREAEVPVASIAVGERVRLRPGERVPVDGVVIEGRSSVDQSHVTGEPMPVERASGDAVIGGSLNGTGTLVVQVTAVGETSFLASVAREVEDARALKPGMLHLVDGVLKIYAPAVIGLATAAAIGWITVPWILGGAPDLARAAFAALSVLVMGYPCALGVSAPLSIVRGAGEAAERGILMRTGEAFQGYRLATHVVFDKTGTLTVGRPALREIEAAGNDVARLLAVAAAVESASEHPLARSIVAAAFAREITPPDVDRFEAMPGRGVRAWIDGEAALVGSPQFLAQEGVALNHLAERIAELEAAGRTVIVVALATRPIGLVAFGDELREGARETVDALRRAGVRTALVTGDNRAAAVRVALAAGIEDVYAGLQPEEKAALVRRLQEEGVVAMIGDGINDAPALMQANIGVAMGGGTDIAIESADIVVLNNRLEAVIAAREVSRWSYRKMVQNVSLAVLFNGIGVPLAATGLVYPVWAMAAMAISVTAIFVNSLFGRPRLFFDAILSVGRIRSQPDT